MEEGVPWEISRTDVLKRQHIQDQVLRYLQDRKSARTQPTTTRTPVKRTESEPIPSVTIKISLQKNEAIKTLDDIPGKPFCLQETKEFDNPAGTQFVPPKIMDNNACTITALAYAVREPRRLPGNNTTFTLSGQPHKDEIIETICSNSDLTMKTDSKAQDAQKYAVQLIRLISWISISFQMLPNNLVWSFSTSLNRRKAITPKNHFLFSNGI